MNLDLTFKDVCSTLKKQGKDDPKLIEAVDQLLGLTLVCAPIVLGPAVVALLPTLAVKNELIKIGKNVFEKWTKKPDTDYLKRHETMQVAYGLLVFTAFFEALDACIPRALRKEISLIESEKALLVKDAVTKLTKKKSKSTGSPLSDAPVTDVAIAFPHPTETLAEQIERQAKLWKQMAQGFIEFVQKLSFWEEADDKKQTQLLSGLDKIEVLAASTFEAQYFELARRFEDFAIWANLQSHKGTKALLGELSEYVRLHARLSAANEKAIDVGFSRLHAAVQTIPEILNTSQATELADSLNKHYQARINEPIIEDKEEIEEGKPRLSFPRVRDAFVPQSFRVLRQGGKSVRLEEESTWSSLPRRNDLGGFLLSYLTSPYSTETPLLVLGHPGSGKSLLTTVLSAKLMSKHFMAIRVPLREVNADADIVTQIEDAIRRITGVSVDSWIKLSALFKNCPPLVILDGYDELLQASGQVFSSYIKDAQRFQEREAEQGRPLRIIITSRVTLIDKAAVPLGATIVRLLEFDKNQRARWCAIWNKSNSTYFREASIDEFSLPKESERDATKVLTLAEQPLLLLMLALYDSQDNQLRKSRGLDRTKLYDSLLRQFVKRERDKEKGFGDSRPREREKALGTEMQRLGVAALGMYNRRKVHILAPELDEDLSFFKLEREVVAKTGKALSQADLLLGSFFFVHKSKAQHNTGAEETHEEMAAFEFLHNTFGEFLTADFILRRAVAQVETLRASEKTEALRSMLEKMLGTADGFERDWFASLVYTPLFTRPVIMEMIREWAPHVFKEHGLDECEFVESLEKIVLNQIKRLLNKREMPSIIRKETAQEGYRVPFGDHPLMGHVAIYSMNLVLLRLIVGAQPFVFDETEVASHEDGTRPWDRLIHIWRSWFALGNLNALTAVMLASRADSKITITAKKRFQAEEAKSRLQECLNVAMSLGDNVASALSGLLLFDPESKSLSELDKIEERLNSEGFDLGLATALKRLLGLTARSLDNRQGHIQEIVELGKHTFEMALRTGRNDELEHLCLILSRVVERSTELHYSSHDFRLSGRMSIFREMLHPQTAAEVASRDARAGRILWTLSGQLCDYEWRDEFSSILIEFSIHRMSPWEVRDADRPNVLEWLRLIRDVGGLDLFSEFSDNRRIHPELFEQMFSPRRLLEYSERNPDEALAYVQLLHEILGTRFLDMLSKRGMSHKSLERLFHPRQLLELSERNPEGVLAYLQILREIDGERFRERFTKREMDPGLYEWMFNPQRLIGLSEHNPEAALAYIQILLEIGSEDYFERFAVEEMGSDFCERMFHPRRLLALSDRSSDAALAYMKMLSALKGGRYFERYFERSMRRGSVARSFGPSFLIRLFERNPAAVAIWLTFARMGVSGGATEHIVHAIFEFFRRRGGAKLAVELLPISALPDLHWLASQMGDVELHDALSRFALGQEPGATSADRPQ